MDHPVTLTNLEDLLLTDFNGHLRNNLLGDLLNNIYFIETEMKRIKVKEQLIVLQDKRNAFLAAKKIIEIIWFLQHKN
jgi:hypothetical protein